jgi:squalene cyclase
MRLRDMMLLDAIENGLRFLVSRQDGDGAWRDFPLPPGLACCWTTAYVLRRVRDAAMILGYDARAALDGGVTHLLQHARPDGWGFNLACPPDADSTAHALLAIPCAEAKHAAALARFFLPEGGARTYLWPPPGHVWRGAHPDVTATALRALGAWLKPDHALMRAGLSWLAMQDAAFWWTAPHYLELEKLRLGLPLAKSVASATSVFDAALALECAILTGAKARFGALLRQQLSDGSWESAPVLRLPASNGTKVQVFEDRERLFTTATVLSALARGVERKASLESYPT